MCVHFLWGNVPLGVTHYAIRSFQNISEAWESEEGSRQSILAVQSVMALSIHLFTPCTQLCMKYTARSNGAFPFFSCDVCLRGDFMILFSPLLNYFISMCWVLFLMALRLQLRKLMLESGWVGLGERKVSVHLPQQKEWAVHSHCWGQGVWVRDWGLPGVLYISRMFNGR